MNSLKSKKFIATALTFVMVLALTGLPLSADERRGSMVEVTMTDGYLVRGELLAVKSDTLLVYDPNARQGKSIELKQVARVKLFKKSKFLTGMAIGLGVGVGMSVNISAKMHNDNGGELGLVLFVMVPLAALVGGLLGAFSGIPEKFSLPGTSSQIAQENLERLKRYAREKDSEKPVAPVFMEGMASSSDAQSHAAKQQRQLRHRFRLLWSPVRQKFSKNNDFPTKKGTFRFVNNVSSKDTAVYPFELDINSTQQSLGQFRLEYELTPHFSPSLEIVTGKRSDPSCGYFGFYSIDFAKQCESFNTMDDEYSYTSLLLGMNWKPIPPSFARKYIVELGIAAGPARVHDKMRIFFSNESPQFNILTWMAKAHVAFDYFYTDNFSLGAILEYQYLRASFPSATFFKERELFEFVRDPRHGNFFRPTEFTIPGQSIQLGGLTYGLRVGLRF